ncbi:hypothetical protein [Nonomuraea endophytica]|uniref:Uncharacterized protein n=1 Tax=Nonomuraea endophytica TaxID=714136 RepID=A0A7W8AFJ3_9ACTN|nr:hypothetical protein [Nonomuraea endophytica]MBB5084126.1 hypothetical protein [Nonomuraea endophytica]
MKRAKKNQDPTAGDTDTTPVEGPIPLVAQSHPDLSKGATVYLRPAILPHPGRDVIRRVVISPRPRTPSPFGGRMGDHTIAWQVHLDALKAVLHNLTLPEAINKVQTLYDGATAWMSKLDSTQMKLFLWLEDHEDRAPRLEDAAHRTVTGLDLARRVLVDGPRKKKDGSMETQDEVHARAADTLGVAVAHYLAYVNYLPYATVFNPSARGSIGSGEGRYRNLLIAHERHSLHLDRLAHQREEDAKLAAEQMDTEQPGQPAQPKPQPPKDPDPPYTADQVKDALWRMFSYDAALRESGIVFLLDPEAAKVPRASYEELSTLAENLEKLVSGVGSVAMTPTDVETKAETIAQRYARPTDDQELFHAAKAIKTAARSVVGLSPGTGKQRLRELRDGEGRHIGTSLSRALLSVQAIEALAKDAAARVEAIIPTLVHEHQSLVAAAYPRSVTYSGFFGASAAEAAKAKLTAELRRLFPKADLGKEAVTKLLTRIAAAWTTMSALPDATAGSNAWVDDAANDPLVVTFTAGQPLVVNGRAPAPPGVTGMGCHTTAWVVQCGALSRQLARAANEDRAMETVRQLVADDLKSEVMKLDRLLPIIQLEGGQLDELFDAALEALTAATAGEAATAYLSFRNLLPFATVDTGDRGGHGEKTDAGLKETYDAKALADTVSLVAEDLAMLRAQSYGARLSKIATGLRKSLKEGETYWGSPTALREAVTASASRLNALARDLRRGSVPDATKVISAARWDEHNRLYNLFHS